MSFWTPERDAQLKLLWGQTPVIRLKAIAARLAGNDHAPVTPAYVSARARELGLVSRFKCGRRAAPSNVIVKTIYKDRPLARSSSYLEREARRRNIGVPELIRRIMQTVTKDKMVNAILHDDVPEVEAPAMMIGGELVERVS